MSIMSLLKNTASQVLCTAENFQPSLLLIHLQIHWVSASKTSAAPLASREWAPAASVLSERLLKNRVLGRNRGINGATTRVFLVDQDHAIWRDDTCIVFQSSSINSVSTLFCIFLSCSLLPSNTERPCETRGWKTTFRLLKRAILNVVVSWSMEEK